uniref:Lipocalin n=1 Tax=Rhipicephalus zambeziensis TaxID=60191 RepID=A0A224YLB6_9ACAR
MSSVSALRVLAFVQLCFLSALAQTSTEKNDVKTENTDAFEILAAIPYAEAIKDTNTNPLFKCLTGRRIVYDPISPSATYEWSLYAGDGQPRTHATFQFTPGDALETATVVINSNTSTTQTARYPYTDYQTCGIMELDFEGHHCTLWVKNATVSVPDECHRQFTRICGEGVSLYDKDTCSKLTA